MDGPERKGLMIRKSAVLLLSAIMLSAAAVADESEAVYRLSVVTDALLEMGEEMLGDPVSGLIALEDTARVEMVLATDYSYHLHVWTDASLNFLEFWVTDPEGGVACASQGDHTSLAVFPDTVGEFVLNIVLLEGWNADTVGYAAALFRYPRQVLSYSWD